jgi:cation diffusion facilitator family transporter
MAGLACNVVLAGLQLFAGWYGQSRAVLADGVHSGSDILIGALVLVGLGMAKRPADESHPFGYGKAESIAAFLVGLLIASAGLTLVYDAVQAIFGDLANVPKVLPLYVACLSIVVKSSLYGVTIRIGRQLRSCLPEKPQNRGFFD